jgi:hypothetical protein
MLAGIAYQPTLTWVDRRSRSARQTHADRKASQIGWTDDGLALWRLIVHGVPVPSRWVVVDQRFLAVDEANHSP